MVIETWMVQIPLALQREHASVVCINSLLAYFGSDSEAANASVNSKHQHPPLGWPPGNFFKVVKFPAPGQKILQNYGPGAKK